MPRYEYRVLKPVPAAEKAFLEWIDGLDRDVRESRSGASQPMSSARNCTSFIWDARMRTPDPRRRWPCRLWSHSLDPRNATLEPETYGDADAAKYGERKPLIWFWMMYDRSPVGLNHWLGHKVRAMLARHVFKHCGNNVKIFHGVEFSFGYNLTVEDNCTIHKYVLLDDRGEIIIHEGSSVSDYANIYSHAHDLNDGMIVSNHKTEIGPKARITYHATVLSGVKVGEHGMVGSMGVASKDVDPFTVVGGIPAKPIKIKSIAPAEVRKSLEGR